MLFKKHINNPKTYQKQIRSSSMIHQGSSITTPYITHLIKILKNTTLITDKSKYEFLLEDEIVSSGTLRIIIPLES